MKPALAILVSALALSTSAAFAQDEDALQSMASAMAAASSFHVDVDLYNLPGYASVDVVRPDDYSSVSRGNAVLHTGGTDYMKILGFPSWALPSGGQEREFDVDLHEIDLEALRYPERLATDAISVHVLEPVQFDGERLRRIEILRPSHQPAISESIVWTLLIGDDNRIRRLDSRNSIANSPEEYRYSNYNGVAPFNAPF